MGREAGSSAFYVIFYIFSGPFPISDCDTGLTAVCASGSVACIPGACECVLNLELNSATSRRD